MQESKKSNNHTHQYLFRNCVIDSCEIAIMLEGLLLKYIKFDIEQNNTIASFCLRENIPSGRQIFKGIRQPSSGPPDAKRYVTGGTGQ